MKTAFTIILCLIGLCSFSQVSIGKIAPMGAFVAELSYTTNGADTVYTFSFNDKAYTRIDAIKTISFVNGLDEFYNAAKKVFSEKNKDYSVNLTLGKEAVTIKGLKSMGVWQAMIYVKDGYTALTEKQVDKLFGK